MLKLKALDQNMFLKLFKIILMDIKSSIRSGINITNVGRKQDFLRDWGWTTLICPFSLNICCITKIQTLRQN